MLLKETVLDLEHVSVEQLKNIYDVIYNNIKAIDETIIENHENNVAEKSATWKKLSPEIKELFKIETGNGIIKCNCRIYC